MTEIKPIDWTPYTGETIIKKITIRKGKRIVEKEYYKDKVNAVAKGNAYIIGNGPSRKHFDLSTLNATGQTYGCNALYRDFTPNFIFSVDANISREISKSEMWKDCVCYAPSLEVNRNKGLNLIPNNPGYISGNQAIWTATVHGHKQIYLIGFDFREYGKNQLNNIYQDSENYGERHSDQIFDVWLTQLRHIIKKRPYCNFTIVHDNPPEYLHNLQTGVDLKNTTQMSYKEFNGKVLDSKA